MGALQSTPSAEELALKRQEIESHKQLRHAFISCECDIQRAISDAIWDLEQEQEWDNKDSFTNDMYVYAARMALVARQLDAYAQLDTWDCKLNKMADGIALGVLLCGMYCEIRETELLKIVGPTAAKKYSDIFKNCIYTRERLLELLRIFQWAGKAVSSFTFDCVDGKGTLAVTTIDKVTKDMIDYIHKY